MLRTNRAIRQGKKNVTERHSYRTGKEYLTEKQLWDKKNTQSITEKHSYMTEKSLGFKNVCFKMALKKLYAVSLILGYIFQ